ncbi:four helix bundle protein, partial [Bacteroidales bacterium OttesenSCG-928-C19]|nr:four helix bundle protein [Bacteroidales bacterium OttesenSCG-928-C19]
AFVYKYEIMKVDRFEDIIAWQKAKHLTKEIYILFNDCRDFCFRDQIKRASISIMNNIAEGFERMSNKELKYFLFVAKGSCGEVRSMLILAMELNLIEEKQAKELYLLSEEISKILSGFIKTL